MAEQQQVRLGFLSTMEIPNGAGYVGGLLVTNQLGRPLEFQCTSPVKPNSTQKILYGPTLVPFILTEVIGKTLIEKCGVKPDIVLTEQGDVLDLREHISQPVACLVEENTTSTQPGEKTAKLGRQFLRFHSAHASDATSIEARAKLIPADADLKEPFERVREALGEAVKAGVSR